MVRATVRQHLAPIERGAVNPARTRAVLMAVPVEALGVPVRPLFGKDRQD